MNLRSRRALSLLGTLLLADGAMFLINPKGQLRLWSSPRAPRWYRRALLFFREHERLCRLISGVEVASGIAAIVRSGAR